MFQLAEFFVEEKCENKFLPLCAEYFCSINMSCPRCNHPALAVYNNDKPCEDLRCMKCGQNYEVKSQKCHTRTAILNHKHFHRKLQKEGAHIRLGSKEKFIEKCVFGNVDLIILWYDLKDSIGNLVYIGMITHETLNKEWHNKNKRLEFLTHGEGKKTLLKINPLSKNVISDIKMNKITRQSMVRYRTNQNLLDAAVIMQDFIASVYKDCDKHRKRKSRIKYKENKKIKSITEISR